jgi:hypothetical protein
MIVNRRPRPWLAVLGLVLVASAASAETTHRVPEDFQTITEAIAAAEWGDTILVGPGVYKESLVLTEANGDGLILKSVEGPAKTSIVYGEEANLNEAVLTFQRCSNSTQIIGFTIDGRGVAKRGVLANSDSRPVFQDIVIDGCEYGIAAHRTSAPYIRDTTIQNSRTSALFISGGTADVKDARFVNSAKFGIYANGTTDVLKLRNVDITGSGQVGIQATDAEMDFQRGTVINNGDTGIICQESSPTIRNVRVEKHSNVGIVLEVSSAKIIGCEILDSDYGVVCSVEGSPVITKCTFDQNLSYHIGIDGDSDPLIGGSEENANRFLGEPEYAVQTSSTAAVNASFNYWGYPCVPGKAFQNAGPGKLKRKPWMAPNLLRSFDDCNAARKYHKKWANGKLDEQGNPVGKSAQADGGGGTGDEG